MANCEFGDCEFGGLYMINSRGAVGDWPICGPHLLLEIHYRGSEMSFVTYSGEGETDAR